MDLNNVMFKFLPIHRSLWELLRTIIVCYPIDSLVPKIVFNLLEPQNVVKLVAQQIPLPPFSWMNQAVGQFLLGELGNLILNP